jgi:ribonuclease P protein component
VRITKARDYAHTFQNGSHIQGKFWRLTTNDSGNSNSRLGLAISKKVYKRAVDRNLFKRLARETFRQNQQDLESLDFVVMIKKTTRTTNNAIIQDLLSLMKNVNSNAKT